MAPKEIRTRSGRLSYKVGCRRRSPLAENTPPSEISTDRGSRLRLSIERSLSKPRDKAQDAAISEPFGLPPDSSRAEPLNATLDRSPRASIRSFPSDHPLSKRPSPSKRRRLVEPRRMIPRIDLERSRPKVESFAGTPTSPGTNHSAYEFGQRRLCPSIKALGERNPRRRLPARGVLDSPPPSRVHLLERIVTSQHFFLVIYSLAPSYR